MKAKARKEKVMDEGEQKTENRLTKRGRWVNKQRVLVFGSRGISFRGRHVMENLRRLLPHTKKRVQNGQKGQAICH